MSPAATVSAHPASVAPPATLACPGCRRADHLHAVEIVEVLTPATFSLGQPTAAYTADMSGVTLADTQRWPAGGAIVCRNCDRIDLRYLDLMSLVELVDPAVPGGAATTAAPTAGAQP